MIERLSFPVSREISKSGAQPAAAAPPRSGRFFKSDRQGVPSMHLALHGCSKFVVSLKQQLPRSGTLVARFHPRRREGGARAGERERER